MKISQWFVHFTFLSLIFICKFSGDYVSLRHSLQVKVFKKLKIIAVKKKKKKFFDVKLLSKYQIILVYSNSVILALKIILL